MARSLAFATALIAAASAATLYRAKARETRALRDHPPEGQFVQVGDKRVHVLVRGNGPDLILLHGASGSLRDFSFDLIDRLSPQYRVIAMDRPGLGHSDPLPDDEASLAAQVTVLKAAADRLGATRPILVGQSFGGTVALSWALDHPAAALVTIASPSLPWPGTLDPWYRLNENPYARAVLTELVAAWVPETYVNAAITAVFAPQPVPSGYLAHLGNDLTLRRTALAANVQQINTLRPQVVAMQDRLETLTLPVEMVHGDADTIVPLAIHSGPLAQRLPAARLTVLAGVGHMPHHTDPDAVLAAIDRAATRAGLR